MENTTLSPSEVNLAEKPQNGWAGLKHWRYDLPAGLLVAMISLPFSIGIAFASDAPPICGITSAIIAGLVLPFLGGSYVTISGPAAGLAPALSGAIFLFGTIIIGSGADGDAIRKAGYPLLLVAICLTGILQLILAKLKVARLSAIFPAAVVEGMLAAIGMMIIVKQLPHVLGVGEFHAKSFWGILLESCQRIGVANPYTIGLGLGALALIFIIGTIKNRVVRLVPPQVLVVIIGTLTGYFLGFEKDLLVKIDNDIKLTMPAFDQVFANSALWLPLLTMVVTLTLIDGVESLATIAAIDKIDPFHRKSDPDRTLLAMGVSNLCSSLIGGLTIIPGGVKSTANVLGGGRTQWANFYNACFLLIFLFCCLPILAMIPNCVLAAVLIFTGFKLCAPKVWRHVSHIGLDQLVIFTATVLITVSTNLLEGIIAGVVMKLVLCLIYNLRARNAETASKRSRIGESLDLFRNPVSRREMVDGTYSLYLEKPLVCFNLLHMIRELRQIPEQAKSARLFVNSGVRVIDHTTYETICQFKDDREREGRGRISLEGIDGMRKMGDADSAIRMLDIRAESQVMQKVEINFHDAHLHAQGLRQGRAWIVAGKLDDRLITRLEELRLQWKRGKGDREFLDLVYPETKDSARSLFWRNQSGIDHPEADFVQGFVEGALLSLEAVRKDLV